MTKTEIQTIEVKPDDDGQRLDRWIKKHAPHLPYVLAQKLMRKGQIRVDSKRAKPDTRLAKGQIVRIPPIDTQAAKPTAKSGPQPLTAKDKDFIRSLIIHEDEYFYALNKPEGLAVQGGSKTKVHIDRFLPALKSKDGTAPKLVHRLDKDTSGLLMIARSAKAAKEFGDLLKKRDVKKIYIALVSGVPEMHEGTIKAPLAKGTRGTAKEKMHVDTEEGKQAVTDYIVLDHAHNRAALVAFWPRTGRTHQIRAHAAYMGCPIVGDFKYGTAEDKIEGVDLPRRLHLHALRVVCDHPLRRGKLDVCAPLPPEFKKSIKQLGFVLNIKRDPFEEE